ncbi:plasma-membrane choline transporter-domain-containing protein [Dactylonectria estremocensis]|uniref:Protein PNS1 n=1 Tax=Dactylonectria estremocensis TaxID=1079267 RepID=A0A9P9JKG8_9HYPO|nr:plasma-membrane choline transporter-domain-containing protein [Dactylonectria estremocensis]
MNYQQQPPPPPQQYQQSYPPPNGNGYTTAQAMEGGEKHSFDQTFNVPKPKYNDLWAGILFLLFFAGFIVVSAIAIRGYATNFSFSGGGIYNAGNDFSLNTNTLILFVFCLVVALVLSYAYVWVARLFPKQFIWVTGILNIVLALGTAIFYLYKRYWSAGIVFLIFGLFMAFCFYTWISRIPFSALMLKTTIDVSKNYGHVYLVSFIGGLTATALAAWYSVTLVAIYVKYQPADNNPSCSDGGCSQGKVIGLIVFVTFTMYWISEWLKNTIHTTIAGVYGSWYFCPHNFPKDATRGAAKRALTYSFGSISLGSLLVAIVQFLRQLCSIARQQEASDGSMIGMAIFCCLGCLLGLLEWAIEFLNRYAFCHIALYGKAYFAAAKDTWKMIKDRGIDALVNECLIGPVLSFGAMFVGYVCALLAYLYLLFTDPAYNSNGEFTPVVLAFAFLIGFQIANIFTTPLSSGIDTIFVAMGWDPQVLAQDHPEIYNEMVRVYPKVQQVIRDR